MDPVETSDGQVWIALYKTPAVLLVKGQILEKKE